MTRSRLEHLDERIMGLGKDKYSETRITIGLAVRSILYFLGLKPPVRGVDYALKHCKSQLLGKKSSGK